MRQLLGMGIHQSLQKFWRIESANQDYLILEISFQIQRIQTVSISPSWKANLRVSLNEDKCPTTIIEGYAKQLMHRQAESSWIVSVCSILQLNFGKSLLIHSTKSRYKSRDDERALEEVNRFMKERRGSLDYDQNPIHYISVLFLVILIISSILFMR